MTLATLSKKIWASIWPGLFRLAGLRDQERPAVHLRSRLKRYCCASPLQNVSGSTCLPAIPALQVKARSLPAVGFQLVVATFFAMKLGGKDAFATSGREFPCVGSTNRSIVASARVPIGCAKRG